MPGCVLLDREGVRLGLSALDRWDALDQVAMVLWDIGATTPAYGATMRRREQWASTFVGSGIALPHGGAGTEEQIRRPAVVLLQFPDGVSWNGEDVRLCVGVAVRDNPVGVLCSLAHAVLDPWTRGQLHRSTDVDHVLALARGDGQRSSAPASSVRPLTPSLR